MAFQDKSSTDIDLGQELIATLAGSPQQMFTQQICGFVGKGTNKFLFKRKQIHTLLTTEKSPVSLDTSSCHLSDLWLSALCFSLCSLTHRTWHRSLFGLGDIADRQLWLVMAWHTELPRLPMRRLLCLPMVLLPSSYWRSREIVSFKLQAATKWSGSLVSCLVLTGSGEE